MRVDFMLKIRNEVVVFVNAVKQRSVFEVTNVTVLCVAMGFL